MIFRFLRKRQFSASESSKGYPPSSSHTTKNSSSENVSQGYKKTRTPPSNRGLLSPIPVLREGTGPEYGLRTGEGYEIRLDYITCTTRGFRRGQVEERTYRQRLEQILGEVFREEPRGHMTGAAHYPNSWKTESGCVYAFRHAQFLPREAKLDVREVRKYGSKTAELLAWDRANRVDIAKIEPGEYIDSSPIVVNFMSRQAPYRRKDLEAKDNGYHPASGWIKEGKQYSMRIPFSWWEEAESRHARNANDDIFVFKELMLDKFDLVVIPLEDSLTLDLSEWEAEGRDCSVYDSVEDMRYSRSPSIKPEARVESDTGLKPKTYEKLMARTSWRYHEKKLTEMSFEDRYLDDTTNIYETIISIPGGYLRNRTLKRSMKLLKNLQKAGFKATRIDTRLRDYTRTAVPHDWFVLSERGHLRGVKNFQSPIANHETQSDGSILRKSATVNYGSRGKTEKFMRNYCERDKHGRDSVAYEAEYKREKAANLFKELIELSELDPSLRQVQRKILDATLSVIAITEEPKVIAVPIRKEADSVDTDCTGDISLNYEFRKNPAYDKNKLHPSWQKMLDDAYAYILKMPLDNVVPVKIKGYRGGAKTALSESTSPHEIKCRVVNNLLRISKSLFLFTEMVSDAEWSRAFALIKNVGRRRLGYGVNREYVLDVIASSKQRTRDYYAIRLMEEVFLSDFSLQSYETVVAKTRRAHRPWNGEGYGITRGKGLKYHDIIESISSAAVLYYTEEGYESMARATLAESRGIIISNMMTNTELGQLLISEFGSFEEAQAAIDIEIDNLKSWVRYVNRGN